jgi:hypothetical protein
MDGPLTEVLLVLGISSRAWIIWSVGIIIALLMVGVVIAWVARSRLLDQEQGIEIGGFTLQELREMRAEERISEVEYQAAREVILGQAKGGLEDDSAKSGAGGGTGET